MKDLVREFDRLPWILKLILALPGIDGVAYGIYRIARGRIIVGILWIVLGIPLLWIVDLICVILYGKVTVLI
jgi:hypothetical protein